MIKPQDIRKGNYIQQGKIVSFYEYGVHVGYGKCYEFNKLDPILITPELLEKCGFEEIDSEEYINYFYNRFRLTFTKKENALSSLYFVGEELCKLKGFHHLQNIIYDLTGKELQI